MKLKTKLICVMVVPMILILLVLSTIGYVTVKKTIFEDIEKGMKASGASLSVTDLNDKSIDAINVNVDAVSDYSYLVVNAKGETVKSSLMTKDGESITADEIEIDPFSGYQFINKLKIKNTKYTVMVYPSKNATIIIALPYKDAVKSANSILNKLFLTTFICMVFCIIIDVILLESITRDLKTVVSTLDTIADGNLSAPIDKKVRKRKDEIGKIMRAVLNLRGQMREVIGAIIEQGESVVDAAEQISDEASQTSSTIGQIDSAVVEISEGATNQATETQNATDNVKVMGDMIEQTKYEIDNLDEQTRIMKDAGVEATDILVKLKDINGKTKEAIDVIFAQTNTTNESALRIQEATDMIANIAEETNLLSLNASIEAARAGEQGRGFAVVANQIQKLAEQSDESAKVIAEIVTNLLTDSEKAVSTMNEVKVIIDEQDEMVENTDKAFNKVRVGIEETRNGVKSIEDKAVKLDEARENVIDIVSSLTAIAQENAASTQQTSASVTEVTAIISDIADNTDIMKQCASSLMEKTSVFTL